MLGVGLPRSSAFGVYSPDGTNTDDLMRNPIFEYQSEGGATDLGVSNNRHVLRVQRGRYRANKWAGLFVLDAQATTADPPHALGVRDEALTSRE